MAKRRSYEIRSGSSSHAARVLAAAFLERPAYIEHKNGSRVRQWPASQMQSFKHEDIKRALSGLRIIEHDDMLEEVPPSAIKYSISKKWLVADKIGSFYWISDKAAYDLGLKRSVGGSKIKFVAVAAV